jgi:short-subunit dehydrogenase
MADQIPDVLFSDPDRKTWLIVGASRGIGLEFVRQLLLRGERILATVRQPFSEHASQLWSQAGGDHGKCRMFICDVLSEASITVRGQRPCNFETTIDPNRRSYRSS